MANADHLLPPSTPPTGQAQEKEVQLAGAGGGEGQGSPRKCSSRLFFGPNYRQTTPKQSQHLGEFLEADGFHSNKG